MLILQVQIHVKPEQVEAFREVMLENARHSAQEPGVVRFDVLQQQDDPTRFLLIEVYRSQEGANAHKETAHYKKWAELAPPMMVEPRTRTWFVNVFPE